MTLMCQHYTCWLVQQSHCAQSDLMSARADAKRDGSRAELLTPWQAISQAIQLLLKVSEDSNKVLWGLHATQAIFPRIEGGCKDDLLGLSFCEKRLQLRSC